MVLRLWQTLELSLDVHYKDTCAFSMFPFVRVLTFSILLLPCPWLGEMWCVDMVVYVVRDIHMGRLHCIIDIPTAYKNCGIDGNMLSLSFRCLLVLVHGLAMVVFCVPVYLLLCLLSAGVVIVLPLPFYPSLS